MKITIESDDSDQKENGMLLSERCKDLSRKKIQGNKKI